jgi:hypothetical protein
LQAAWTLDKPMIGWREHIVVVVGLLLILWSVHILSITRYLLKLARAMMSTGIEDNQTIIEARFSNGSTQYANINSTHFSDSGYFSVIVPASTNSPYELNMFVSDFESRFIRLHRGLLITRMDRSHVIACNIPLILPSSKVCADAIDCNHYAS